MKKIIAFIVIFAVLAGSIIYIINDNDYPTGLIFNYMENHLSVNTDDYIVVNYSMKKYLYNKKAQETTILAGSVFDLDENGTNLIGAKDNTLYYIAVDDSTGGSAIYAFNLDSLDKEIIDTKNEVSNFDAFLGTEDILGIADPGLDIMSIMMSSVWINSKGRHDTDSVRAFLSEKDATGAYGVSNITKICTTDDYIFFVNELSTLYVYSYADNSFAKLADDRITDFFITENNVYYYSADKSGKLFVIDYAGKNNKYVTDITLSNLHIRNGIIYAKSESSDIYKIDDEKCDLIVQEINEDIWNSDGYNLYVFDSSTENFSVSLL